MLVVLKNTFFSRLKLEKQPEKTTSLQWGAERYNLSVAEHRKQNLTPGSVQSSLSATKIHFDLTPWILTIKLLLVKSPYGLYYLVQELAQSVTSPCDTHSTFSRYKVWTWVSHSICKSCQFQTLQRSPKHHQSTLKHITSMRKMPSCFWSLLFGF